MRDLAAAGGALVEYDGDALDRLALLFTLVKILFLSGVVRPLPRLIALVERARRASATPLHQTTVRNEHAYYCCIAQLTALDRRDARDVAAAMRDARVRHFCGGSGGDGSGGDGSGDVEVVYMCGDSHALSPAWKALGGGGGGGARRVLVPALVTGLKHWHLRPATNFYPKANFYNVVARLPRGARVVFMFGEIDCREGILVAVEKLRYDDVDEGIRATVAVWMAAALRLVDEKALDAYVHPIIPVLNETRHIVRAYNAQLEAAVKAAAPRLAWLDGVFDELLTADGEHLRPEYALDGTHLHPRYLETLVGPSLDAAARARGGSSSAPES